MRINSRAKGSAGEREFCRWLKKNLELDFLPERNLEQVRNGGADIMCVEPFCIEVKRCQTVSKRDWWLQVSKASTEDTIRVVAYRKNNQPWRFLISATRLGLEKGFVQLEEFEMIQWMKRVKKLT